MATSQNTYDITLNKDLFVDPDFKKVKKFGAFFPLKYATIDNRKWEKLSSNARSMLTQLISIAYTEVSRSFTVNVAILLKYRGNTVEMLLSELSDFNYLESSILKENLNNINIKENLNKNTRKPKTKAKNPSENLPDLSAPKANEFISLYCEAFKAKHNASAEIDGKSAGIAKRIIKTLSREKWVPYLRAFFTMPDAILHKNKHPLNQFELKLQEIAVFAQTASFTTQSQAYNQDKKVQGAQVSQAIQKGENF